MKNININNFINSEVHLGHKNKYLNPSMKKFIYCNYKNINIIDINHTIYNLKLVSKKIINILNNNGKILFVGTKKSCKESIEKIALDYNQFFINNRWLGGILTNWGIIKKSIKEYNLLTNDTNCKNLNITKKEKIVLHNKIKKIEKNLRGIKNMIKLPEALFIIDINKENTAVNEAIKMNIPIFALTDTNSNINKINLVIPANDDSIKSINICINTISEIIKNKIINK